MKKSNHIWSFSTVGGVKRVNLESGSDLIHLEELDPKLWTALSCPVHGLEIDKKTLEIIDADKDGQIRVPDSTELGKNLLDSAKIILKNLGKEGSTILTVEETSDTEKIFAGTKFNGDGIITEDSTSSPELIALLNELIFFDRKQTVLF